MLPISKIRLFIRTYKIFIITLVLFIVGYVIFSGHTLWSADGMKEHLKLLEEGGYTNTILGFFK